MNDVRQPKLLIGLHFSTPGEDPPFEPWDVFGESDSGRELVSQFAQAFVRYFHYRDLDMDTPPRMRIVIEIEPEEGA